MSPDEEEKMAITDQDELRQDEFDEAEPRVSVPDGTVAGYLRAKREEIVQRGPAELELDVPGYDGALVVTYRYPDGGSDQVVDAVTRAQNSKERDALVRANADVLVACCYDIRARVPGGELEPIDTDPTGDRSRFNKRLAALLGIDVPEEVRHPARFVCQNVFSPAAVASGVYEGDLALMNQGGEVVKFLVKADEELSELFVGE
jgi:hypothetical protein